MECWYKNKCKTKCTSTCPRFLEFSYLVSKSGLPINLQEPKKLDVGETDYNAYCKLNKLDMLEFVKGNNNLLICSSNTGNGKTSWAIKLMFRYFDKIWAGNGFRCRAKFIHIPTLLTRLKNFDNPISEEEKKEILESDLVIWDDIASTNLSHYDYNQLLAYIDQRNNKSNIYTSNFVNKEDMEKAIGVKLTSRIFNSSMQIEFFGKDRRGGRKC